MNKDGQLKNTFSLQTDYAYDIVDLPNGQLTSVSGDKTNKIFNSVTSEVKRTLTGHSQYVWKLKVMSNGELASSSWDGTIKIWSP